MGPILFNVYIIPIFKIIDKYKLIKYHSYADDLQLYIECSSENDCKSVKLLNECINEITEWFNSNSLKINPEKTKIIYINLKGNSNENNPQLITINNIQYKLSDKEKNIGVLIDKNLNMLSFINAKVKSANYQLHNIRIIRKTITFNTCKLLIQSLVISILDYFNILLINLPAYQLIPLNKIIRSSIRVLYKLPPRSIDDTISITELMRQQHLLPINFRIIYKLLVTTHLAYHHRTPTYLVKLIKPYSSLRVQRSHNLHQIQSNTEKESAHNSRVFSIAAPIKWNRLDINLRSCESTSSFKRLLKTHLFIIAYEL